MPLPHVDVTTHPTPLLPTNSHADNSTNLPKIRDDIKTRFPEGATLFFPSGTYLFPQFDIREYSSYPIDIEGEEGTVIRHKPLGQNEASVRLLKVIPATGPVRIHNLTFDGFGQIPILLEISNGRNDDLPPDKPAGTIVVSSCKFQNAHPNPNQSQSVYALKGIGWCHSLTITRCSFSSLIHPANDNIARAVDTKMANDVLIRECLFEDIDTRKDADAISCFPYLKDHEAMLRASVHVTDCSFVNYGGRALKGVCPWVEFSNNHLARTREQRGKNDIDLQCGRGVVKNNRLVYARADWVRACFGVWNYLGLDTHSEFRNNRVDVLDLPGQTSLRAVFELASPHHQYRDAKLANCTILGNTVNATCNDFIHAEVQEIAHLPAGDNLPDAKLQIQQLNVQNNDVYAIKRAFLTQTCRHTFRNAHHCGIRAELVYGNRCHTMHSGATPYNEEFTEEVVNPSEVALHMQVGRFPRWEYNTGIGRP